MQQLLNNLMYTTTHKKGFAIIVVDFESWFEHLCPNDAHIIVAHRGELQAVLPVCQVKLQVPSFSGCQ